VVALAADKASLKGLRSQVVYVKRSSEQDMAEKVLERCESLRETFRVEVNWYLTQCKDGFPLFACLLNALGRLGLTALVPRSPHS
jgi:hypothetical protein